MRGLVYFVCLLACCHAHLRTYVSTGSVTYDNRAAGSSFRTYSDNAPQITNVTLLAPPTRNRTNSTLVNYARTPESGVAVDLSNQKLTANVTANVTNFAAHNHHDQDVVANVTNFLSPLLNVTNFPYKPDRYGKTAEYFGNVVSCAGKTFLLTRLEPNPFPFASLTAGWQTRVREVGDASQNIADLPSLLLTNNSLSHNVAGVCVGEKVYLVGGQFRRERDEAHWKGIWIAEADPKSLDSFVHISTPRLMLRGDHEGCKEARGGFVKEHGPFCEFDGRFSVVHFRGRFILFARANLKDAYRAVQMTASKDLVTWSPFRVIQIREVNNFESNIYFLVATVLKEEDRLAGYFPGAVKHAFNKEERVLGLHFTSSEDGLYWTAPKLVHPTKGIYDIHPVGMFHHRLMTQEPTSIENAFKLSQKFNAMEEMTHTLTLTCPAPRKHQLMRTEVSYNMDIWNE